MSTRALILGAGFGGLELASRLSSMPDDIEVTLIDQNDAFVFGFSKLDVLFEGRPAEEVGLRYSDIRKPGVDFVQARITGIDPATRTVTTTAGRHEADILVVALGADYDMDATPGLAEGGQEFYSLSGAERARSALLATERGAIVVAVLGVPFKCPPAPFETAFLLHDHFERLGTRSEVEISVVSPMPAPVPPSPQTSAAIVSGLEERGIAYTPGKRVVSIDPARRRAELDDGGSVDFALLLGVPVHKAPDVVVESGLTEGGTDGWVAVDPRTLRTDYDGVYAIGDVADAPVPRAGVFAESAAGIVAQDIAARLRGEDNDDAYQGNGTCYIEFGDGLVGRVDANFLGGPEPRLPFTGPTRELAADKRRFEADRRKRWFG